MSHAKILINFHYVVVVAKAILIFFPLLSQGVFVSKCKARCSDAGQSHKHTLCLYIMCVFGVDCFQLFVSSLFFTIRKYNE